MGGGSPRVTTEEPKKPKRMDIRMDPQDQTLWEGWRTMNSGGQCGG